MAARQYTRKALLFFGFSSLVLPPGTAFAAAATADAGEVDDIVVTATRLPRHIMDIAGTVTVITDEDVQRQVATDLDDLIRYQPGITMSTTGRGGNMGFVIRGMGGNRVLTMIDGIRAGDAYQAGPVAQGADMFEVDDLKAVEIIRGPASVLYGADAMGGAVILRTRDPLDYLDGDDSYVSLRAGYMSANAQAKLGLTGATQLGDVGLFAQYTNRAYEERDIAGEGDVDPLDGKSHGLLLKSVWTPGEHHKLKIAIDVLREDNDFVLLSDLSSTVFESLAFDEMERTRFSLQHDWNPDTGIADQIETHVFTQTSEGLQRTRQDRMVYSWFDMLDPSTYGGHPGMRLTDYEFDQETSGVGVMLTRSFTAGSTEHALVYGVSYDQTDTERPRDRFEVRYSDGDVSRDIVPYPFASGSEQFPNKTFPDTKTERLGVYIQDEIAVGTSGITIIPGLRYDSYDLEPTVDGLLDVSAFGYDVVPVSESHTSANLGLIYDVTDQVALFAQYSEGFRPPSYNEANQAYIQYAFGYAVLPNPNLRPETSEGIEAGIKANLDSAFFSFAVYDNRYEDFISTDVIGLPPPFLMFQAQNLGKVRIRGAEAIAAVSFADNWELTANLAYAHGDDEEAGVPLDSVDPFTAVLGLRYTGADDRWSIEPRVTLVAEKDRVSSPDAVTADAYALIDVVGSVKVSDRTSLRLGLFNVTDEEYARWANIQGIDMTQSGAAEAVASSREPGVNLRATLNVSF